MQLDKWLELWREAVEGEFGAQRVYFMGIQGSRARGEAREESDIDVVLILDALTADDAERYRKCVAALPERDKLCGFVSGRRELERWLPEELFSAPSAPVLWYWRKKSQPPSSRWRNPATSKSALMLSASYG